MGGALGGTLLMAAAATPSGLGGSTGDHSTELYLGGALAVGGAVLGAMLLYRGDRVSLAVTPGTAVSGTKALDRAAVDRRELPGLTLSGRF